MFTYYAFASSLQNKKDVGKRIEKNKAENIKYYVSKHIVPTKGLYVKYIP